jgi:hypothetical protein
MKNLILDFETLGINVHDCAVIDCSFFIFDTDKMLSDIPYTTKTITEITKCKLNVKEQVDKYGWKVYDSTIQFWQEQTKEVQKQIAPRSDDLSIDLFATRLLECIQTNSPTYWWTRSSTFDPWILWRTMESLGKKDEINKRIPHFKHRDTRTFIDAKLDFPKENGFIPIEDHEFWNKVFQKHNSSWDVLADVLRIQAIIRAENDLEMIKR